MQQPWAWAILAGGKRTENRSQRWSYRGPLAIHSGKAWSERGGASSALREAFRSLDGGYRGDHVPEWLFAAAAADGNAAASRGALLGVVDLVDVHTAAGCCAPWGEECGFHLVLERPRLLSEPIECRGSQGLWAPPMSAMPRLEALR